MTLRSLDRREARTIFAWKPAPFGRYRRVPPAVGQRWPVYERNPRQRADRRDWSPDEVDRLYDLIEQGKTYDEIALALRRSRNAVMVKLKRSKGPRIFRHPTVLTACEVGRLLGLSCAKQVAHWVQQGWLKGKVRKSAAPKHSLWAVQYDDLIDFLQNQRFWPTWRPERISDPDLREQMIRLRAGQPRWLSTTEVAQRFNVGQKTVSSWVTKGQLPAQKILNRLMIWEPDLEGWVIPCERERNTRASK